MTMCISIIELFIFIEPLAIFFIIVEKYKKIVSWYSLNGNLGRRFRMLCKKDWRMQ